MTLAEMAAGEEKPRGERRRLRVPTSVLVTRLVAVLSIWWGPRSPASGKIVKRPAT